MTRGEIPSKAVLDEWTAKQTRGLIREFPLLLSPLTVLVLATTLATKVGWLKPFRSVPSSELDVGEASDWPRQVQRVLRTPSQEGHMQFIAQTDRVGDVCAHTVLAREDLAVTSVVADRRVPAADVIATAYDLAVAVACGRPVATRSLFDLPLGDSPLWTISEEETLVSARAGGDEMCTAVLPAWSGEATHDLRRGDLGFPAAAAWLAQLTRSGALYEYEAKQSVVARYNRRGFEAAAVAAMAMVGSAMRPPEQKVQRRATLRFAHPFAVVAVTRAWADWVGDSGHTKASAFWHALPVYSAWVTVPTEAEKERDDEMRDVDDEALPREWVSAMRPAPPERPLAHAPAPTPQTPWSRALDWIKRL